MDKTVARLRAVLDSGKVSDVGDDILIPGVNAGCAFRGKTRIRSFPWGKAALFLTTYVQGRTGGCVNNSMLILVVQGLTRDGRYVVRGEFPISHPSLPDTWNDGDTKGRVVFSIDEEEEKAAAWLDRQPDESFRPSLKAVETMLEALEIR